MADNATQSYASHTRWDPPFHFFAMPVLIVTFLFTIYNVTQHQDIHSAWAIVLMLALIVVAFKARINALRAQDRIIRLEERMRLATLLPDATRSRIGQLTE